MPEGLDFVIRALDGNQQTARNGKPYWLGRDIMDVLAYKDWRDFRDVIEKAKVSCDMAGNFSSNHFVRLDEKVEIGSGAHRTRENYALSKYACYLVAMNGDPGKARLQRHKRTLRIRHSSRKCRMRLPRTSAGCCCETASRTPTRSWVEPPRKLESEAKCSESSKTRAIKGFMAGSGIATLRRKRE